MKSWQLKKSGSENLHLIESPTPQPGAGQILVRTKAVSLNYRDKLVIEDKYPLPIAYPLVPGSDLAGEVVAIGSGVSRLKAGDQVISLFRPKWLRGVPSPEALRENLGGPLPGVLAEYVLLSEQGALAYPDYLTPAEASTLPVAAITAWVALFKDGNLKPGETVLLQGSGGVSLFALQLAVAHGARVLATSRSPGKIARLKQLGAAEAIDTSANAAWDEVVLELTHGRGVDHVLDVIGGDAVPMSIQAAAWGGHIALIGIMDRPTTTFSILAAMAKTVRLQGVSVGSRDDMEDLLAFVEKHQLSPIIDARYNFNALPDAVDHLDRGPFGKLVVEIN
ncbi:MAG TPA: NAD(P)-dependent alcohol dehydrogenase [Edaphobacter sp.]|nr:NAD(P)-dependent alcohol dehydrogenase [Edaphobacter sp.]